MHLMCYVSNFIFLSTIPWKSCSTNSNTRYTEPRCLFSVLAKIRITQNQNLRFEMTTSMSFTMFGWLSLFKIFISLMAVIGNYEIMIIDEY